MNIVLKWMFAWLAASILTFLLASVFHSQFVLLGLTQINIDIPMAEWIGMTLGDILGLSLSYGIVIALAFFCALVRARSFLTIGAFYPCGAIPY